MPETTAQCNPHCNVSHTVLEFPSGRVMLIAQVIGYSFIISKKYCCCEIQISRTTDNPSRCVRSKLLQKILDHFQQHDFFFPALQREFYDTGRHIAVSSILTLFLPFLFPHVISAVHNLKFHLVICKVVRAWFHSWVTFLLPLRCWFEQHSDHVYFILKDEKLVASGVGELNDCFSKAFTKSVFKGIWNTWHSSTINGIALINWERIRLSNCA